MPFVSGGTYQPFPEIGKRIASQYRRTIEDCLPRLDDIDLAVSSGGSLIRHRRYSRLLLPWKEPGGDRYVTVIRFDKNLSGM
jgi:hypothetical protein